MNNSISNNSVVKSKLISTLLSLFPVGLDKYYLQQYEMGVIQTFLVLSVIGTPVSYIWSICSTLFLINTIFRNKTTYAPGVRLNQSRNSDYIVAIICLVLLVITLIQIINFFRKPQKHLNTDKNYVVNDESHHDVIHNDIVDHNNEEKKNVISQSMLSTTTSTIQ